jgi:hypothetical protein
MDLNNTKYVAYEMKVGINNKRKLWKYTKHAKENSTLLSN